MTKKTSKNTGRNFDDVFSNVETLNNSHVQARAYIYYVLTSLMKLMPENI